MTEHHERADVRRKSLRDPDERRQFPHGGGDVVRVGTVDVGRAVLEPGWRWSVDLKPMVRTPSNHATARIMAAARPSEVVTSAITRALAEGAAVEFVARGAHELKGLPQPVDLYAVRGVDRAS